LLPKRFELFLLEWEWVISTIVLAKLSFSVFITDAFDSEIKADFLGPARKKVNEKDFSHPRLTFSVNHPIHSVKIIKKGYLIKPSRRQLLSNE
jgi:hypothetical protein